MIILLNGTSSAGKTTIAKILQEKYQGVLLLYGVDSMVQNAFPAKCDYPPFDEQAIKLSVNETGGQPLAKLIVSPYMYPVYEAAVRFYKMLSAQGYAIIIDELLFDENRVTPYFEILSGETVYFIGIKPDKEVVIRRENERGDRLPGLAAGLYNEVYNPLFTYDLLLDSGKLTPDEAADLILRCLEQDEKPRGFSDSGRRWLELHKGSALASGTK
jgi:chloramphenicol 3-O phosphotransferase